MPEFDVQFWIENAQTGIRDAQPNMIHASTSKLRSANKSDVAEQILKEALKIYPGQVSYFRELSSIIIERNPAEGLTFAEAYASQFGSHALFQKALALSKLGSNAEAINVILSIIENDKNMKEDRWIASKLAGLYIRENRLEEARRFLEPLVDSGIYNDVRMKQILATILIKMRQSLPKVQQLLKGAVDPQSSKLKQKAKEVETIEDLSERTEEEISVRRQPSKHGQGVFLVHGHDNESKQTVARFLEKLEIEVTILHEKPNLGRTIIEKFEQHADVGYAVVLLTPDDIGKCCKEGDTSFLPRARQNVVFELGYFLGALGRKHVCALKAEGVEEPSDLSGVLYIPLDAAGAWRLRLAGEMKAAGLNIDLNRAL